MGNDDYNIVSKGVCGTVAYFENGADYSALAPRDTICPGKESHEGSQGKELESMIEITMFLGLLFLLLVMFRSCSRTSVDWYRLIFLYILGTLGVPISIALGPKYGGFNRIAGFGVMVHNMCELFILGRIWRGMRTEANTSSFGTKFVVMYVWIILTLLTFLPLSPLFLIAMLQGGFMDWTLVLTFLFTGVSMQKYNGKYFWWGFAAALTHILSIQPLFFGFATALGFLDGITVILLIPTFILYMWFASADTQTPANIISPVSTGMWMMDLERNKELEKISHQLQVIEMEPQPLEQESEPVSVVGSPSTGATGNQDIKSRNSNGGGNDNGESINNENSKDKTVLNSVLDNGLLATKQGQQRLCIVLSLAFVITLTNALVVFFSPCFISTKNVCK